jgi:hypothetical protein
MNRTDNELLSSFSGPIDRATALSAQCPLPSLPGVYAWFFRTLPPAVPASNCLRDDGRLMLYVGIAPDKPGKRISKQTLRSRIRYHLRGNAEGSTLRRTLGILLADKSGFPLRRVGSGQRMTLTHPGEQWLDNWLEHNALIYWRQDDEPWSLEDQIIKTISCPLNIKGNQQHPFYATLRKLRADAIMNAKSMPVAHEDTKRGGERIG